MNTIETKPNRAARNVLRAVLLGILLALAGVSCGQRGPLYLPQQEPAAAGTASAAAQAEEPSAAEAEDTAAGVNTGDDEEVDEETP